MIESKVLVLFLLLHLLGDCVFQPRNVSVNKSKDLRALRKHGLIYGGFMCGMLLVLPVHTWIVWFTLNVGSHLFQDWHWYRITPIVFRWKEDNPLVNNRIFVAIGLDQFIHYVIAITTLSALA